MRVRLVQKHVAPFGNIWFPRGGGTQIAHLGGEVAEYFASGVALRPGDVVVDVGANVGTFAMHAASLTDGLRFICIEPIPALFEALSRNFETHPLLARSKRSLHRVGLTFPGDVAEADFLFFSRFPCDSTRHIDQKRSEFEQFFTAVDGRARAWARRRLGSVMGRVVGEAIHAVVADLPKGPLGRWGTDRVTGATRIRCPLVTADRILADEKITDIAMLKVDVEGAELDVLRGISRDNWRRVRHLALEGHDEKNRFPSLRRIIEDSGFDDVRVNQPESARARGLDNFLNLSEPQGGFARAGRRRVTVGSQVQVFKFGGTSVGSAEAIRAAVVHVRAARTPVKTPLVVVVSAMDGITDLLLAAIEAARADHPEEVARTTQSFRARHDEVLEQLIVTPHRLAALAAMLDDATAELLAICRSVTVLHELTVHTRDAVVARGERMLAAIFAETLDERGLTATLADAAPVIFAQHRFGAVWPDFERSQLGASLHISPILARASIVVVPGFLGTGPDGELMTLGRGGTDLTAAILARVLSADRLVLYKDVDGLMTAEIARLVPDARVLPELHYREAAELAYYGAKVLHPRTILPLLDKHIPLWVRNTFNPSFTGTRIAHDVQPRSYPVKALSAIAGQALVSVTGNGMLGVPGIAGRTFGALAAAGHSVSMITQASSEASICFVVPEREASHAARALHEAFAPELASGVIDAIEVEAGIALIAVVGLGMRGQPGIAARVFSALSGAQINVAAIAQGSSELNITVALKEASVGAALNALHGEFQLHKLRPLADTHGRETSIALLGFGQLGRALVKQLGSQATYFRHDLGLELRCVAVSDRRCVQVAEAGFTPPALAELALRKHAGAGLAGSGGGPPRTLAETGAELARKLWPLAFYRPVLVDLTAEDTASLLRTALGHGFHLVLANKKPLAIPQPAFDSLFAEARERRLAIRYEATVGAGLPVLDTLAKLREAGDPVESLLGCLSGTLGFLLTQLEEGVAFSAAVARARVLGFTEPDPREDLSGLDVGRKALILARTLGLKLELSDIEVGALFPPELSNADPEEFCRGLRALDEGFEERMRSAKATHNVLRYVARIERGRVRVGLEALPEASPMGRLLGTDNQVAIYTKRYAQNPLVVTGPGAGAEVTAAGVLNDLVAVASLDAQRAARS